MSKSKLIRQQIWSRLQDVALPDFALPSELRRGDPGLRGVGGGDRPAGGPAGLRDRPLRLHHPRQLPGRPTAPDARCGQADGDVDLRHLSRLPACWSPAMVPPGAELYAAWLDGMEHFGRPITLAEIAERGRFDFMVTGASAVSIDGVRFGKGHGFFDLEWGMFTDLGHRRRDDAGRCRGARRPGGRGGADAAADRHPRRLHRHPDAAARGRAPRQAPARREVGAARPRRRSPRRRRFRSCSGCKASPDPSNRKDRAREHSR